MIDKSDKISNIGTFQKGTLPAEEHIHNKFERSNFKIRLWMKKNDKILHIFHPCCLNNDNWLPQTFLLHKDPPNLKKIC